MTGNRPSPAALARGLLFGALVTAAPCGLSGDGHTIEADAKQVLEKSMTYLSGLQQRGLLSGHFSAPEIAEVFGMHERTLHRRLRAAGTSFRQELDTARRRLSEQLLTNTSLAVGDIATALGYADASGFIRAFDRWCGTTPASWRKQNFLN